MWFFSSANNSCCLQKQMNIELQVERLYKQKNLNPFPPVGEARVVLHLRGVDPQHPLSPPHQQVGQALHAPHHAPHWGGYQCRFFGAVRAVDLGQWGENSILRRGRIQYKVEKLAMYGYTLVYPCIARCLIVFCSMFDRNETKTIQIKSIMLIINVNTFCENIVSINLQATGSFIDNYD